jgi:hypothetical protein
VASTLTQSTALRRNVIGLVGICIALVGVAVAVFQDDLRANPSLTTQVRERVGETVAEIAGVESEPAAPRDWVTMTYLALGLAALAAGVASFLRHENQRVSGMAGALGIIVVGWEYVLIGVLVAVVLLIIMNIGAA